MKKFRETVVDSSKIIHGNCLDVLPTLKQESVQCVVTSPPYWGLRDYKTKEQIGQEKNPQQYIEAIVEVFKQLKRILRTDGVAWLNLGDCYGKGKQLQGIPWRVALSLQSDGWILRSDVIWHKICPMPAPVNDRPTTSHEYVFQITKSPKYFYDKLAVSIPAKNAGSTRVVTKKSLSYVSAVSLGKKPSGNAKLGTKIVISDQTNLRSVWSLPPFAFALGHFATFPIDLPITCIKASTSHKGQCSNCGRCWKRLIEVDRVPTRPGKSTKTKDKRLKEIGNRDPQRHISKSTTIGWKQDCSCERSIPIPCIVLDPFAGACTTGLACQRLYRNFIGIEINEEYIDIAKERLKDRGINDRRRPKESITKGFNVF